MSTRFSGVPNLPRRSAVSAVEGTTDQEKVYTLEGLFRDGAVLKAYVTARPCFLCGHDRRLFVLVDGVEICYLDYDAAHFNLAKALGT